MVRDFIRNKWSHLSYLSYYALFFSVRVYTKKLGCRVSNYTARRRELARTNDASVREISMQRVDTDFAVRSFLTCVICYAESSAIFVLIRMTRADETNIKSSSHCCYKRCSVSDIYASHLNKLYILWTPAYPNAIISLTGDTAEIFHNKVLVGISSNIYTVDREMIDAMCRAVRSGGSASQMIQSLQMIRAR